MGNRTTIAAAGFMAVALVTIMYILTSTKPAGGPMVEVSVPQLSASEEIGRQNYDARCASCHGVAAAGQSGVAPPLVHPIYKPDHHGDQSFAIAAMSGARSHHWPFGDMPPVEGIASSEISSIISYVRALQVANGIE